MDRISLHDSPNVAFARRHQDNLYILLLAMKFLRCIAPKGLKMGQVKFGNSRKIYTRERSKWEIHETYMLWKFHGGQYILCRQIMLWLLWILRLARSLGLKANSVVFELTLWRVFHKVGSTNCCGTSELFHQLFRDIRWLFQVEWILSDTRIPGSSLDHRAGTPPPPRMHTNRSIHFYFFPLVWEGKTQRTGARRSKQGEFSWRCVIWPVPGSPCYVHPAGWPPTPPPSPHRYLASYMYNLTRTIPSALLTHNPQVWMSQCIPPSPPRQLISEFY